MDFTQINSLFSDIGEIPKYVNKEYVEINDQNNGNYNTTVKFSTRNLMNDLCDFANSYILIDGRIEKTGGADYDANTDVAIKNGSNSLVQSCIVKINGTEIDHPTHNYLTFTVSNLLEYSDDFSRSIGEQYGYAKDAGATTANNTGHTKRKLFRGVVANGGFNMRVCLPLQYLSTFFRSLNFPLVNCELQLEINFRRDNSILRAAAIQAANAPQFTITNTQLVVPVVKLDANSNKKFYSLLQKGFKKSVNWGKQEVVEVAGDSTGQINYMVHSSFESIRRLIVLAIPEANWDNQTNVELPSTTITNVNVLLDGRIFYPRNITTDHQAYELLKEHFNNGGVDKNTGSQIGFNEWKTNYKIYALDLSRQEQLERDPRKSQEVRFKGTLPAGNHKLIFILEKDKETVLNFSQSTVKVY